MAATDSFIALGMPVLDDFRRGGVLMAPHFPEVGPDTPLVTAIAASGCMVASSSPAPLVLRQGQYVLPDTGVVIKGNMCAVAGKEVRRGAAAG